MGNGQKGDEMRKCFGVLVAVITAAVLLSGCAQMRDKFIRKPKEETTVKQFYSVRKYDVHPNMELYTKRYIFWKTWHKELLDVLDGTNRKKIVVAVEQELSNLIDMQSMLVNEKAEALQPYVEELTTIERTIKKEGVTRGNRVQLRRKLELLGKQVKKDFSYRKVQGMIADDFRDEADVDS